MREYTIKIKTFSDTMLGSGESIPAVIDSDVKYDEYGLPYMFAKTLKGHIREQMELIVRFDKKYEYSEKDIPLLMGVTDTDTVIQKEDGRLRFSDVRMSEGVQKAIKAALNANDSLTKYDILDALTVTYTTTRIDKNTGTAADGSLRRERMVRKGVIFETKVYFDDSGLENVDKYDYMIKTAFAILRHIGTHKSKGKGRIAFEVVEVTNV